MGKAMNWAWLEAPGDLSSFSVLIYDAHLARTLRSLKWGSGHKVTLGAHHLRMLFLASQKIPPDAERVGLRSWSILGLLREEG